MFELLRADLQAVRERDPAAPASGLLIYLTYPGVQALVAHRRAARWLKRGHPAIARLISQRSRKRTGIEIHPGAKIGKGLLIDHGMGVVIGETAEIGDNCTIYHGVTLGGTGKETGKRHPTVGNNVFIGTGARLLGSITVGDNSKIAAGSVVLCDIPANCTAVGSPAQIVKRDGLRVDNFDNVHIPDPVAQEINLLQKQIDQLKAQVERL